MCEWLPVVQYLHTAMGPMVDDTCALQIYTFQQACANGHLPVVQYLQTFVGLAADDRDHAVHLARENGHLHVVRYINTASGLTADGDS